MCSLHKTYSLQSSFQQLKSKHAFFATAISIHCQTVPGISLLHNLQESVLGWIFQLSCATQINSVLSGELFSWHKQCAGHARCLMTIWTIFFTFCYTLQEDWWNKLLIRFILSYGSVPHITKISNFIHIIHKSCTLHLSGENGHFRQKFPLLLKHGFTFVGKLLAKTS